MHKYRTHKCNELGIQNVNENVKLSGWVHRKRDHGQLIFIDLRDHYGLTQVVIDSSNKNFSVAEVVTSAAGPVDASTSSRAALNSLTKVVFQRFSPSFIVSTKTSPCLLKSIILNPEVVIGIKRCW